MKEIERNTVYRVASTGVVLSWGCLAAAYIKYGRVFLDAGFYLDAAYRVWHGYMLYQDFFYVQGPVYPYIYGAVMLGTGIGILPARLISLILGAGVFFFVYKIAGMMGRGSFSGFWGVLVLASAPVHAYYFSSAKLYALTGFFLSGAIFFLVSKRYPSWRYPVAMVLVTLAAGTRLTVLPAAGIVLVYIVVVCFRSHESILITSVMAGVITGLILSVPFLIRDADAVLYNLIRIHTSARYGPYVFGMKEHIWVLLKNILVYPAVVSGLVVGGWHVMKGRRWRRDDKAVMAVLTVVTAVHFSANWFSVGYQSVLMPLAAGLAGGWLGRFSWSRKGYMKVSLLMVLVIIGGSIITANDPIWKGPGSALANIRNIGLFLSRHVPPSGKIAACSAVPVYQAKRRVMSPFGGAPFTFTPGWDEQTCRRYGGINEAMLIDKISRREASAWVLEKDSFSIGFPGFYPVSETVQKHIFGAIKTFYREAARFPDLGDGKNDLIVYLARER